MAVSDCDSNHPESSLQGAKGAKAVLFDIGRVIVRLNLARAFAPVAAALEDVHNSGPQIRPTPQEIWSAIQSSPGWHDWQEGRLTAEQWHEKITHYLNVHIGFTDFCAAWNRALDPEPVFGDEFFAKLGEGRRLALVSNTDPIHVDYLERHFSFVRYFPVRIYSCRVGASKPDPAIYEEALRSLQVAATDCLYVDDIAEYVISARRLGMDAIQFESPAQLAAELESRGIRAA